MSTTDEVLALAVGSLGDEALVSEPLELTPAEHLHRIRIQGAAALLATADDIGQKLTVHDVGIALGEEGRTPFHPAPWAKPRVRKVVGAQYEQARLANREAEKGEQLAEWLDGLTETDRADIRLEPETFVDDLYLTPMRLITGSGEQAQHFPLGQAYAFLEPITPDDRTPQASLDGLRRPDLTLLPEGVQQFLRGKAEYLATLGIDNGAELDVFITKYFDVKEVHVVAGEALPPELERLVSAVPGAREVLQAAGTVRLRQLKAVPPAILDHIHTISQTQNHLTRWIKKFVQDDLAPVILPADYTRPAEALERDRARLDANPRLGDFRHDLLIALAEDEAATDADLDGALAGITNFADLAMGMQLVLPRYTSEADRAWLAECGRSMNQILDADFGRDIALDRMMRAMADRHSDGVFKTLLLAGGLIATGGVLEQVADHSPAAAAEMLGTLIFVLALLEDPVSEAGEAISQHALGYPWKQIVPRYKLIAPVAAASIALGFFVKTIANEGYPWLGALTFAVAGCATTLATMYKNITTTMDAYRKQVAEGRVPGREAAAAMLGPVALDSEAIRSLEDEAAAKELIDRLTEMMASGSLTKEDMGKAMEAIEEALASGDIQTALQQAPVPYREVLGVAFREVIGNSMPRAGKLGGAVVMLGSSAFLAPLIFAHAMFAMAFSMGEPATGIVAAYTQKITDRMRRPFAMQRAARAAHQAGPKEEWALPPRPGLAS